MSMKEFNFGLTVQPANIEFLSWKPFSLSIDDRQRHLLLTGSYKEGQKKYLAQILSQDIEHLCYADRYGQLAPTYEHSQLINGLTVISSENSMLKRIIHKESISRKKEDRLLITKKENAHTVNVPEHVEKGGFLFVEYEESAPKKSVEAITDIMSQLQEQLTIRKSSFIHSLIIEDADLFFDNIEFAKTLSKLVNDKRLNRCAVTINFNGTIPLKYSKALKNKIHLNMGNLGFAELTTCGNKEKFSFMPFAPVESLD